MIWLNSKREKSPSLLFALCFKKVLATLHQFASENWLSSLGTPDEMDSVFISLVYKVALFCRFYSRNYIANSTVVKCMKRQGLKLTRNPPIHLG